MEKKAASKQIMYAAVNIIVTTSLITKQLYAAARNEAWIVIVAGSVVSICILMIYKVLADRFEGLSIMGINDAVFGRILGKIVSALYIYFFFTITALNVNILGGFVKIFILPDTPTVFVLLTFVVICAWAVRKGGSNVLKYSAVIAFVCIAIILINTLLLLPNMEIDNVPPFLDLQAQVYIVGVHSVSMIPLCDPVVLMMFLPVMKKPGEFGGALAKGLILGAVLMLIISLRNILVLGQSVGLYSFPSMVAVRQIDVGDVLTRIDIFYVSIQIMMIFYKVTVLFYASIRGVRELMGFKSGSVLINILGALLVVYALSVFRSMSEHQKWLGDGTAQLHHTFFVVVLPALTLLTAFCRGIFRMAPPVQEKAS